MTDKDNTIFSRIARWMQGGELNVDLHDFARTYRIERGEGREMDGNTFIQHFREEVIRLWERMDKDGRQVCVKIMLACRFRKGMGYTSVYFHSSGGGIAKDTNLGDLFDEMSQEVLKEIREFDDLGSSCEYDGVEYLEVEDY